MKKKIIIIALVLLVIVAIALMGFYFIKQNKSQINFPKNNEQQNQNNAIATEDFSINLPAGWSKTINTVTGVTAMAANPNEKINDSAAQKINFKSYLAISFGILEGKTMSEYMQSVKSELQTAVPSVVFTNEKEVTINGRSARAVEVEITQQGIDFKVLIVVVKGNNDDVWLLSYNTTKSAWDEYKEAFSNSVNSFIIKK